MAKFEMFLSKPEDRIFMDTIHSTTNVAGQTIKVGTHFATLSGKAELSMDDRLIVWNLSLNKPDYEITQFDCEIVCGPIWNDVNQCSFVISTAEFGNTNADEDDTQGWQVVPKSWDLVLDGLGKRIRLNFTLASYGQHSSIYEVSYKVTATGSFAPPSPPPPPPPQPVPCNKRLNISDVSSTGSADSSHSETSAIDGDDNTFWMSTKTIHPRITVYPEGSPRKICRVDIKWQDSRQYYFRISLGTTAGISMDVITGKSKGDPNIFEKYEFFEQTCSFVQITVTESEPSILPKSQTSISEIALYGKQT